MKHLQRRSGVENMGVDTAKHSGADNHHNRPDLLPLDFEIVSHHLIHKFVRSVKRTVNNGVHLGQFSREPFLNYV